jgi:5'-nucleotidase / UDP-sugar diphosphatase
MCVLPRLAALILLAAMALANAAVADTARITVLLTNDIYVMGDRMMPDGGRRGGFARLAAVVKGERARAAASGGHVIFAHAGDTLSPSLMSGIDRGAHIIVLTNLIAPDIFAPGNHEFDFGKATFLRRMGEAAFPRYAANLRGHDGQPLQGFKDRSIVTIGGVRIGLTGVTYDDSARASSSEDLKFESSVVTVKQQAEALRREGADFVVAVAHVTRRQGHEIFNSEEVDLTLTGAHA